MKTYDVAVIGSGFAGTILARVLHRKGLDVLLLERGRHPRFAIGESSTPLANLCLERLARRYDLPDLYRLAAHGRWIEHYPEVRRGLKRGFTFYRHESGRKLRPDARNQRRLLVAASPDDEVADSHWLRADVDHFLVRRAEEEGVEYRDLCEVVEATHRDGQVELRGRWREDELRARARFVVDASGKAAVMAAAGGIPEVEPSANVRSSLLFGHFESMTPIERVMEQQGTPLTAGPYPDERAAVHHLIAEGWMYVLPFDHDCVSAGFILNEEVAKVLQRLSADEAWHEMLRRYPTLANQFGEAKPVLPVQWMIPMQHRLRRAIGDGWAALPHAYCFLDPMFSTGIAWSLLAVERLAGLLVPGQPPARDDLIRYENQLSLEAGQLERLLAGALAASADFQLFTAQSFLYFATVSFDEMRQRLFPEDEAAAAWYGFLGAGSPATEALFAESFERLHGLSAGKPATEGEVQAFTSWVLESIREFNVIGLGDSRRRNLYPVDLDLLLDNAGKLGLERAELERRLPLLRGAATPG